MRQVGRHGHNVILDVAQVQADFGSRRNFPVLVAALCEALDDIRLVAKKTIPIFFVSKEYSAAT